MEVGGQTVRVTTRARGPGAAQPFIAYYYVAEPNPSTAEQLVAKHLLATDEKIEAADPIPRSAIDRMGLKRGQLRMWP
jgi:hypothetical protein